MENVWLATPTGSYINGSAFTVAMAATDGTNYYYQLLDSADNIVYTSTETYVSANAALAAFGNILASAGITGFKVVNLT